MTRDTKVLIGAAIVACAILVDQWRPSAAGEYWNPLTVAWQRAHCPERKDLRPFAVGGGRLIEATVLQLGASRLYLPTEWHRPSGLVPWDSPAPLGVGVIMGGSGRFVDDQGRIVSGAITAANEGGYPSDCLGHVLWRVKGARRDVDPDFRLSLRFRFASTDSAVGSATDHGETVYGYQVLRFTYNEGGGSPDRVYEGAPAMVFPSRPGAPETRMIDGRPMTFRETADGSFVSWRITPEITGSFEVTRRAPPGHTAVLARKAMAIWRWLQTPPAQRDNGGRMTFKPAAYARNPATAERAHAVR